MSEAPTHHILQWVRNRHTSIQQVYIFRRLICDAILVHARLPGYCEPTYASDMTTLPYLCVSTYACLPRA